MVFGLVDLIYAYSMISADPVAIQASTVYRWFAAIGGGLFMWAAMWALVGVVCIVFAFQRDDRAGFIAAIGIKVLWGILSAAGWIMDDVPVSAAGIWLGLAWLVSVIAGWPEAAESRGEDAPR